MVVTTISSGTEAAKTVNRDLETLRATTAQVVGSVFYGTLLKTMRQSVIRGGFGHGGRGEEIFAGQLDALIAERAGAATRGGLGETLYRWLERQQESMSRLRFAGDARTPG